MEENKEENEKAQNLIMKELQKTLEKNEKA